MTDEFTPTEFESAVRCPPADVLEASAAPANYTIAALPRATW